MNSETKQCQNCMNNFIIEPEDFLFYEKIAAFGEKHLKKGGKISINDYNHTKVEWSPAPPKSMLDFYEAFLGE